MARKLHAWVFQTGEPLPHLGGSARPMRAANVTDALLAAGHRVTLWSSDFNHQEGRHLTGRNSRITVHENLEVRLVHSKGYSRNVGAGRLVDHAQLALRLRRLLKAARLPDVAFVGYPPIEPAAVMTRWLRERDVPTLLDVKDQWPDVLLRAVPEAAEPAGRLALSGYTYLGRRAMREATAISSISEPFLEWALEFAGRPRRDGDVVLPLTSRRIDPDPSQWAAAESFWNELGVRDDGRPRATYVGTLSTGLDVEGVIAAARQSSHQFVICGRGSTADRFEVALGHEPNVVLPGWVDAPQATVLAERTSVTMAPYVDETGFRLSVPNKVYDALAHGIPLITNISGLVEKLVIEEGIGRFYTRSADLSPTLEALLSNPTEVHAISARARTLFERSYSYDIVYGGLVTQLERLTATRLPVTRHA